MARIAFLQASSGAAGDMFLATLLDAGMPFSELHGQLKKLQVGHWSMRPHKVMRGAIGATWLQVEIPPGKSQRGLAEIGDIVSAAGLDPAVERLAIDFFKRLAAAEAKVHRMPVEKVHFHEVGAVDAILDLVGAAIGAQWLDAESITVSPINTGSGQVQTEHGLLPVPAPATLELLTAAAAPVYSSGANLELLTPTGAVILTTLAQDFGPLPAMRAQTSGYGAGSANPPWANVLRLVAGQESDSDGGGLETVLVLETNIDDVSPEVLGYAAERCFAAGALDTWFIPIQMKKFRPAVTLCAICRPGDRRAVEAAIFAETGTLGIRHREFRRRALARTTVTARTPYGPILVKVSADLPGQAAPEFEAAREAARVHRVPLLAVMEAARRAAVKAGENEH